MVNTVNAANSMAVDKSKSSMNSVFQNHNQSDTARVQLNEDKCLGYINLRLDIRDSKLISTVEKSIGIELPKLNLLSTVKNIAILGLGPDEWLIIAEQSMETEIVNKLNKAIKSKHALVTDISGGMTTLNISGDKSQCLLEKGTYADLHHSVFKIGDFYSTNICKAPVIIIKNDVQHFSLIVRRSFSEHIANWAIDAACEYK